jgi:hypothetical protein
LTNYEILAGKSDEFFKVVPNSATVVVLKQIIMNDGCSYEYTIEFGEAEQ